MLEGIGLSIEDVWNLILFDFREEYGLLVLIAGLIISFILSFAVGANDSANSWGTSVGAGTVSLGWAYVLGSIMEIVGCTLLSGDVIKKVVNGIVNIEAYRSNKDDIIGNWTAVHEGNYADNTDYLLEEKLLGIGCISVMLGSGIWQLIASTFSWPVSGTHCIIFGLLGFTVTAKGPEGIKDVNELTMIIVFLFVSIIVSMFATGIFYYPLYKYCIRSESVFTRRNKVVYSVLTGLAIGIPVTFIVLQTHKAYDILSVYTQELSYGAYLISTGIGLVVAVIVAVLAFFFFFSYLENSTTSFALTYDIRFWLKKERRGSMDKTDIEMNDHLPPVSESPKSEEHADTTRIFRPLQVVSAMTSALVHGGNDVANCIGPFVVVWYIYMNGVVEDKAKAPIGISLWGGAGIALGLVLFGKRVIMTMGSGISEMTSSRGFCVEWVASLVVLLFTAVGYPLSTTHCKVGGLIGAGLVQGLVETGSPKKALKYVNFRVLSGVVLSWVLTIPFAFGLSSLMYTILKAVLIN